MEKLQSIKDGKFKVEIAQADMPAIKAIIDQFSDQKPFAGKNILGCVTVTPGQPPFLSPVLG
jgi:S-adenosylhomocysteine hydrolase